MLSIRKQLRDHSDLSEFGAAAIRRELDRRGIDSAPSLRTIGYILQRNGGLDYRHRFAISLRLRVGIGRRGPAVWPNSTSLILSKDWSSVAAERLKCLA